MQPGEIQSINLDEIIRPDDEMVFVRGVAGSGKTTMVDMITLKWAKRELGKAFTKVDFLFRFNCRELNNLPREGLTLENLIIQTYPEIFEEISLQDLMHVSERVLIMVDGMDELSGIYENDSHKEDFRRIVFQLMSPKQKPFLRNHKTIVSGRPKACEFVHTLFSRENLKTKAVHVCGFNSLNIERYITNFFADNFKANRVLFFVNDSKDLKAMASIPVFLWVICSVFSEDLIDKPVSSNVELYFYACIILLRNHFNRNSSTPYSLYEIAKDQFVIQQLYLVMILSTQTYMNNQVLFTDEEIGNIPYHLELTGFIVKYNRGNMKKPTYQFKHLIMQEFLCAMYLTITKDIRRYKQNRELSSCLPSIVGIHQLIKEQNNELFTAFYSELDKVKEPVSELRRWLAEREFNKFIRTYNIDLQNNTIVVPERLIVGTKLNITRDFFDTVKKFKNLSIVSPHKIESLDEILNTHILSNEDFQIILRVLYCLNIREINHSFFMFIFDGYFINYIIELLTNKKIIFETVLSNHRLSSIEFSGSGEPVNFVLGYNIYEDWFVKPVDQLSIQLINQIEIYEIYLDEPIRKMNTQGKMEIADALIQNAERLCRMHNICLKITVKVRSDDDDDDDDEDFHESLFYKKVLEKYENSSVQVLIHKNS